MDLHRLVKQVFKGRRREWHGDELKSDGPAITPEERARLEEEYLRTHPPQVERISGCCDRADQS